MSERAETCTSLHNRSNEIDSNSSTRGHFGLHTSPHARRTAWGAHLRLDKTGFKRNHTVVRSSLPTAHVADLLTDEIIRKFSFGKYLRTELSTKRDWSRSILEQEISGLAPNTPNPWASSLAFLKQKLSLWKGVFSLISTRNTGTMKLRSFPMSKQSSKR